MLYGKNEYYGTKESLWNKLHVWRGDITQCTADAIVNVANTTLLGGGGVDGAIHKATGVELLSACRKLNGCETGEAKIIPGFKLPAQFIIHTVGPIYERHPQKKAELLRNCYKNCLAITPKHDIYSISFPATSCGVYGYPAEEAAHIAIATVMVELPNYTQLEKIIFVVFSDRSEEIYRNHIYLLEKK